ncbi:galactose-1-phosphate uridyl transferase [Coemansia spiralis]|uniref:Galactose-1-phosphate uridylyltransferase n=2 Tax=Coemansia TaxID=4863 RepID=A0A9W8GBT0_9FUNG|nr:galactose-1-phosphate uridyl transferase [Coemansia spiralis]KAJ1995661.1 galactose-1-phosphate uridyl transferase [Coemansia umbellata]KAJ2623733.1 galactose-1-phosphate uridyl transferase [Coemansia sp. RSA 1358]KAJ2680348.1 galactose-1-phosphate uridyl transferase [Coemansia spiralis]
MSTEQFSFSDHSHRRFNPLTRSWVLCSPHRAKRPWLGQVEEASVEKRPEYDPECYLCPGNKRATGAQNDNYASTYVFPNDYAAVHAEQPDCLSSTIAQVAAGNASSELFQVESTCGQCKVVCFSPRHDLTLPELELDAICEIVRTWQHIYTQLSADPTIQYVQIFENKGSMMGCSNPHPHGQVWALSEVPSEPRKEIESFKAFKAKSTSGGSDDTHSCLLCNYVKAEEENAAASETANRIIVQNNSFVALVPFWAVWPFETMIAAKSHVEDVTKLSAEQIRDLAAVLKELTCRYDNIFQCSFPYSMGLHQSPIAGHSDADYCHFHMHFYPPLLRSATVRKFLVGFEMMAEPQRDLTAEQAASRLRAQSTTHYKKQKLVC